ncbi:MAG: NUDIX hydrolase [Oscillospiraceae bacterium]
MKLHEETVDSQVIYDGRIIKVRKDAVKLCNGKITSREVVEHPGGVCIAAIDDEKNIYVVDQFRYPMGAVVTELPAGKLEWGEDPDSAAVRELCEETGCTAKTMRKMGVTYPSPGYCGEVLHLYVATGLMHGQQSLDEDEFLTCRKFPLSQAVEMVMSNEIKDSKSQILIMMAKSILEA